MPDEGTLLNCRSRTRFIGSENPTLYTMGTSFPFCSYPSITGYIFFQASAFYLYNTLAPSYQEPFDENPNHDTKGNRKKTLEIRTSGRRGPACTTKRKRLPNA
ncbi:hypothetical protein P167DRAFT_397299 [Morchella conica CCBAS932]|uniref:Uncharacterized protein n=1 Tax=Morchella conica CCBAS932 TaxID=1392247 RepID=A0A3N4KE12_9PEZI|nr:hypothetical protein P167DRAFT_397299 [Morchella conica CCBAS932]